MDTTKKQLYYVIDPQDIFDPFYYVVPTSWSTEKQKWVYEDIIAPAGLIEHHEYEYQTIRQRGLLPQLGSITGDHDVDFSGQVSSCRQVIRDMDKLVAMKVKGVYWGEDEKDSTVKDKEDADGYRKNLTSNLLLAAKRAANYILDWERTLAYMATWKLSDPAKTLAYIRKCANKMKAQYDTIVAHEGYVPDGVGRLKFDHILGKTDEEIVLWMCKTIMFEPKANKLHPLTPDCITPKVARLKQWVDGQKNFDTLDSALAAFDLAKPPTVTKKRSHAKKQPLPVTPTHLPVSDSDDPRYGTVGGQPSDQVAVEALTSHYVGRCQAVGLDPTATPVIAGPIYYVMGEFRYDTAFETCRGSPDTIPLDKLTVEQANSFQQHLEAFDVAFQQYLDENTHIKAQATLAKGIMTFLRAKKAQDTTIVRPGQDQMAQDHQPIERQRMPCP